MMTWLILILLMQNPQQDLVKRGEQVFSGSCATGYCHAPRGGSGAGAPRLAARGFEQSYIASTISNGLPGTAMQGFAKTLPREDLTAVIAYVASLNGITIQTPASALPAATARPALSVEAARGRDLFSDAVRSFGRCSTCHEVNNIGISVAAPISSVPANVAALRALTTPAVGTASVAGETMPALAVSKGSRNVIFYDLTTPPPVLRTADPASVTFTDGSSRRHSSVIGSYKDDVLAAILAYLRAILNAG